MWRSRFGAAWLAVGVGCGCAPALREPPPVAVLGLDSHAEAVRDDTSPEALVSEAEALFAKRPDPAPVAAARERFLAAARSDPNGVRGLLGVARADAWLIEHERDGAPR